MKYVLLIHQGDAPTPYDPKRWNALPAEQRDAVQRDYIAISETPGVTPGPILKGAAAATTVRVAGGETVVTNGPFAAIEEALGGWLVFEADDLDAAIELASRFPAARMGGAVEIRPVAEWQ